MHRKLIELEKTLKQLGSAVIAYSGGVDSTFLATVACDVLPQRVLAVTAASSLRSPKETEMAKAQADELGIRHLVMETDELSDASFVANDAHRCYHCKRGLFERLRRLAQERGLAWVIEGSNYDDLTEWRAGKMAAAELGVRSPLSEVGLSKSEIRELSRERGLANWDKPAESCLATRIPYGTSISGELLQRILSAEDYLRGMGVRELRVRHRHNMARIEVKEEGMELVLARRAEVVARFRSLGYTYVTLDRLPHRQGG